MLPVRRNYCTVGNTQISALKSFLTEGGKMLTSSASSPNAELDSFNKDWLGQRTGKAPCVLLPSTTNEVKNILAYCNQERIAVVPQAGNTGLVYGSVPVHDEIVLSVKRMNKLLEVKPETFSARCDAGIILHDLHVEANKHNMIAPLDLGARGSCCVSGNVATNAGGIHFARYGSMRANTLGMRTVLANGKELNLSSSLRKDNTGYDLKQLFIGSEGTLGIITEVELKLHPLSSSVRAAMIRVGGGSSSDSVLKLYHLANKHLAEVLAAFEVMDAEGLISATQNGSKLFADDNPLQPGEFAVLVETRGANEEHDMAKLLEFAEAATEEGIATDFKIANTNSQNADLWAVREELPTHLKNIGPIYKFDLCFPLHQFYSSVEFTRKLLKEKYPEHMSRGDIVVCGFGHFGDGNVHLNIMCKNSVFKSKEEADKIMNNEIKEHIYLHAAKNGGSVSAEHGVGEQKFDLLKKVKDPEVMHVMGQMKKLLDPNEILNPYKIVDACA